MESQPTRTEVWETDPVTGESRMVERFDRVLDDDEILDLAVAAAIQEVEILTVEDVVSIH